MNTEHELAILALGIAEIFAQEAVSPEIAASLRRLLPPATSLRCAMLGSFHVYRLCTAHWWYLLTSVPSSILSSPDEYRASIRCGAGLFVTEDLLRAGHSMLSLVSLKRSLAGLAMQQGRPLTVHLPHASAIAGATTLLIALPIAIRPLHNIQCAPLQIGAFLMGARGSVSAPQLQELERLAATAGPAFVSLALPRLSSLAHILPLKSSDEEAFLSEDDWEGLPLGRVDLAARTSMDGDGETRRCLHDICVGREGPFNDTEDALDDDHEPINVIDNPAQSPLPNKNSLGQRCGPRSRLEELLSIRPNPSASECDVVLGPFPRRMFVLAVPLWAVAIVAPRWHALSALAILLVLSATFTYMSVSKACRSPRLINVLSRLGLAVGLVWGLTRFGYGRLEARLPKLCLEGTVAGVLVCGVGGCTLYILLSRIFENLNFGP
jgi:hypothetical protein